MHQACERLLIAGACPLDEVSIHRILSVRRGRSTTVY